jgi:ribosome-associated heat shock protein Hsp15
MTTGTVPDSVRLDLWLWAARFFKTRALAKSAIESHRVEVAGQGAKPSRAVRAGERLRIRRGDDVFEVDVLGVSEKRGSAPVAQTLYRETDESRTAREAAAAERRAAANGYRPPLTKPDKRARRLIQALGDLDAI